MKKYCKRYLPLLVSLLLLACQSREETKESGTEKAETKQARPVEKLADESSEEGQEESPDAVTLTAQQYRIAGIQLGKPEPKNLSSVISVNGLLDVPPQNQVSISTPLGGFVRHTELLQGMRVRKGQVIATIENPEFISLQQEYLENKSRLEYLELEYARQKELAAENVTAAKTFQQTTAEYRSIQARVLALKEKLSLVGIPVERVEKNQITRTISVHAPISGYVTEVNVNVGRYVNPTDVLFEIVDTEHLHVELTVFEKDVPRLKKGQKIRFTLPNELGRERRATLYLIGREISPERTVRVHAHMDQEDMELLPGTYVKALIETAASQVPALPEEAFVQSEGKDYVFLYQGKRKEGELEVSDFKMVAVQKGIAGNGFAEVALTESMDTSRVVTQGAYSLLAKLKNTEEEGEE